MFKCFEKAESEWKFQNYLQDQSLFDNRVFYVRRDFIMIERWFDPATDTGQLMPYEGNWIGNTDVHL